MDTEKAFELLERELNQKYQSILSCIWAKISILQGMISLDFDDGSWKYIDFPDIETLEKVLDYNQ